MKLALVALQVLSLSARTDLPPGPSDRVYDGAAGDIEIATPAFPNPVIRIDGRLDEAVWADAALLSRFTQYEPVEGVAGSQETEVLVFVTDDAIYFGIRARDNEPDNIRATLAERDAVVRSDDYVRISLDTFNDQRGAYVFVVNPLGVQQDGIWTEGGGGRRGGRGFGPPIDYNPDLLWESSGRIVDWGYVAELRIPIKSLRFPDVEVQDWGLQVVRRIERLGYEQSWAPITKDVANLLAQAGQLKNLRGLDAGLFLEVGPVITGKRFGEYNEDVGRIERETPEGDFGVDVRYGITSNLILDATYNPDFSQVEADAGQIAVNERFSLFFPEKRPFFLEGTEIFGLPKQLVHTRSVQRPVGGAKVTGKLGGLNVGYLGAVDRVERDDIEGEAFVNLLRARKDLGSSSTVGLIYTDRTESSDLFNRVAGADARLQFRRRYTLTLLGAMSRTAEDSVGRRSGGMFSARIERASRVLSFNAEIENIHPDFIAGSGFLRRTGETLVQSRIGYNRYGQPGALVERWGPTFEYKGYWDHEDFWGGDPWKEYELQIGTNVSLKNNFSIWTTVSRRAFRADPSEYQGLVVGAGDASTPFHPDPSLFEGLNGARVFFSFSNWDQARGRIRFEWRETPLFERSLGVPIEAADSWIVDGSVTLRPSRSLTAEVGLRHETLDRKADGSRYSSATIPRLRAQYQFTRALFIRGIVEYSSQEREAFLDPATGLSLTMCDDECETLTRSDRHDIHLEGLVTYEPSPGTVFYIGYSREMEDSGAFDFRQVVSRADGLFAKISYRFRR